jgi:nicotinamidase/pyrazinamidase
MAKRALVMVDVTNDFACPDGGLPVKNGAAVVPVLNRLKSEADSKGWVTFATRDKHPANSKHFKVNGGAWPKHGEAGTWGFGFHPDLDIRGAGIVSKGMSGEDDGYSAFEGITDGGPIETGILFEDALKRLGVEELFVGGLATDYCVKATAIDGVRAGFRVFLVRDACRAVNADPKDEERAIDAMRQAGVEILTSDSILGAQ